MGMRWSLDSLYSNFNDENFCKDYEKLNSEIENIRNWCEGNFKTTESASEKLQFFIKKQNEFYDLFSKLSSYAHLTLSVDAKNETALKIQDELEEKATELTKPLVLFEKWVSSIDNIEDIISENPFLNEHGFYIKQILEKNKYLLSEKEEVIISKMKNTGSNAWNKLQELLTSTLLVDITLDGELKHLPLPVVRNMAFDRNQSIRKSAYEAELKSYEKIADSSAAALNGIKGEVITISKLRGYKSPLEKTLLDSRMDQETLDAMISAIKEYLPVFRRYYRKKAEILGHDNGLPFYDLFAPVGDADMKFTYDEAREFIIKNFRSFSEKLANLAERAFNEQWIDAEPRQGKRGGAFCSNLHPIKESRILANFTGSFNNVSTLAHELGHAYHGYCLKDETYLNSRYPMPIAETASIFCETIIKNAALKDASKEEAFTILESDLQGAAQVIVDIYSRFLFESELFRRREKGSLSVNELNEIMLNAQREAYGNGLDNSYLHPYMWVNKPHYYYPERNFYNFPYAFGLLFAKGLYAEYINRGAEFVEDYDRLLSVTGKMKIADITSLMGIDIHSIDFWRSSLNIVAEDIEKFINLCN
ncbi:oligoendopeptidase F [Fervidicella metallireducens AeB]|uniref:Oligoendopeptidase F n=1 Tax=Fervidicella metallireducens AeB TaxID=1403537 RepID=A0A017RZE7_9CLOT|nr:oligoendopeptidase F [Fervidicella metallireducens AeB]